MQWSGRLDLNQRPPEPHSGTLPDCATPRPVAQPYATGIHGPCQPQTPHAQNLPYGSFAHNALCRCASRPSPRGLARQGKELLIAVGPEHRTRNDPLDLESVSEKVVSYPLQDPFVDRRIADDTALGNIARSGLELRLDEGNHRAVVSQLRSQRVEDLLQSDERQIDSDEVGGFCKEIGREVARVGLFVEFDPWISPKAFMHLVTADVDGDDSPGVTLEQAIGKSASRGSDIEHEPAARIDPEGVEGGFEFESPAAHIGDIRDGQRDLGLRVNFRTGFRDRPTVDPDLSGKDKGLGALAAFGQSALRNQYVQSLLRHGTPPGRTSVPRRDVNRR